MEKENFLRKPACLREVYQQALGQRCRLQPNTPPDHGRFVSCSVDKYGLEMMNDSVASKDEVLASNAKCQIKGKVSLLRKYYFIFLIFIKVELIDCLK